MLKFCFLYYSGIWVRCAAIDASCILLKEQTELLKISRVFVSKHFDLFVKLLKRVEDKSTQNENRNCPQLRGSGDNPQEAGSWRRQERGRGFIISDRTQGGPCLDLEWERWEVILFFDSVRSSMRDVLQLLCNSWNVNLLEFEQNFFF